MDHQSHEPARFWYYYDFSPLQPGRYYCGDCFQLLPAIESGTVDMVLIDPPYYMGKDKAWDCFEGRADYMAFMGRAFIQAQRILKENGTLGFWHNDLQKITWLCDWLERNTDMRFATWGIWVKPNHRRKIWVNPGPGNTLRSWFNIGEFCVFFVKGTAGTAWNKTGLGFLNLIGIAGHCVIPFCFQTFKSPVPFPTVTMERRHNFEICFAGRQKPLRTTKTEAMVGGLAYGFNYLTLGDICVFQQAAEVITK